MNIEKVTVNFVDSELGNKLWDISFDKDRHDFDECFETAMKVMYLPLDEDFDSLKEKYPELTRELYDIADEILEHGDCGVTDDRFCEFLVNAFGFMCKTVDEDVSFDVEKGEWV